MSGKAEHEIVHGARIAALDPERIWGWKTPAGMIRAVRRAEWIASSAGLSAGKRALEIGCGTGNFTEIFARSGSRIVAVDISPELIEKAMSRGLPPDRVVFLRKRFEECAIDGPFDAVIGSSVLHHLDIPEALAKIYALLKPGGIMSFAEPNMMNPQIIVQKNIPFIKASMGDSPDETAFFRWRLSRLLWKTGFEHVRILPCDWLHPATPPALINAFITAGKILERLPVIREFSGSLYLTCRRPVNG
jgi:2-polyprenyl-3-methyl-5-hydroxy-6-metoxy-1,4-benzoquinol methylase